jgi:7,8-dihydropterin-6-yl-methyl-4-(beta-D-ribofuranosyl)aminobenzene 5'-phosphate synthase
MASSLLEVDSLEALIIIDNELDSMSSVAPDTVNVTGRLRTHIAMSTAIDVHGRGDAMKELRMDNFCCSAHGLSILIVRLNKFDDYEQVCFAISIYFFSRLRQEAI